MRAVAPDCTVNERDIQFNRFIIICFQMVLTDQKIMCTARTVHYLPLLLRL